MVIKGDAIISLFCSIPFGDFLSDFLPGCFCFSFFPYFLAFLLLHFFASAFSPFSVFFDSLLFRFFALPQPIVKH